MHELTIHTYGGGEILYKVFNALALLFNSSGGPIQPLAMIVASIGGVWAISKAFFSSPDTFFQTYLLPLIVIPGIFMIPTSKVHIEDVLVNTSYTVDRVPLFLAKFSEIVSSIGYTLTTSIEKVMHSPNDAKYSATGMIFGSEVSFDISRYKIANADLEQNLRSFSKQCVLYDLAFGRYSMDDLQKTTDLWKLLKDNTSNIRMIHYRDPTTKKSSYLPCSKALVQMEAIFEGERKYLSNSDLIKNLPMTLQVLTGLQKQKEEEISQQLLMLNLLAGDFSAGQFAKSRAQTQQRNTYLTLGSLASSSVVTLRTVIEVLIYVSFIFVVPLSLFPGGVKLIISWAWLVIWIQLWPPLYAVLNYIMQISAKAKAAWIFGGLSEAEKGLSFFTSVGLENLNNEIYALSGFLALSIPFIAQYILQGGTQSLVNLTGSLMSPLHSASNAAAAEQTSGNYSFANTNVGQLSYENSSAFQKNFSPSISSGFMTEHKGDHSSTYTANGIFLDQKSSNLRTSYFSDENMVENLQKAHQHSQTSVESDQKNYMESCSKHLRAMGDITEHLSKAESYNESHSTGQRGDVHESAKHLWNEAENFGQNYNISTREGLDLLVGASNGWFLDTKISHHDSSNKDELLSAAKNITNSEDFQAHFQKVKDFAATEAHSVLNDEGTRIVEGYTRTLDEVYSSQEQYQASLSKMNQVSENLSWAESHSQSIKQSLNQDFMNWANQKYSAQGGYTYVSEILNSPESRPEKEMFSNEFIQFVREESGFSLDNFQAPETHFSASNLKTIDAQDEFHNIKSEMAQEGAHMGMVTGNTRSDAASLYRTANFLSDQVNAQMKAVKESAQSNTMPQQFNEKQQSSKSSQLYNQVEKRVEDFFRDNDESENVLSGNFHMSEKPFWIHEEE
ncbi:MAG: hypothetical protein CK425_11135 [Parachlamydia sp.]|nr:MAG: hypothetical protein CK425_11135 [Parachlamydia sp.]